MDLLHILANTETTLSTVTTLAEENPVNSYVKNSKSVYFPIFCGPSSKQTNNELQDGPCRQCIGMGKTFKKSFEVKILQEMGSRTKY